MAFFIAEASRGVSSLALTKGIFVVWHGICRSHEQSAAAAQHSIDWRGHLSSCSRAVRKSCAARFCAKCIARRPRQQAKYAGRRADRAEACRRRNDACLGDHCEALSIGNGGLKVFVACTVKWREAGLNGCAPSPSNVWRLRSRQCSTGRWLAGKPAPPYHITHNRGVGSYAYCTKRLRRGVSASGLLAPPLLEAKTLEGAHAAAALQHASH